MTPFIMVFILIEGVTPLEVTKELWTGGSYPDTGGDTIKGFQKS
jgi:hypothetical protein